MTRNLDLLRKVALSLVAGWTLLALSRGVSFTSTLAEPSLPPEASPTPSSTRAPARSPLLFEGIPLASEFLELSPCELESWNPESSQLWNPESILLHLDRSTTEVTAAWIERSSSLENGTFHGALVTCEGNQGQLVHTYTTAPLDPERLQQRWAEPVTERPGPVPLLDDAIQLTAMRTLEWTVYLDELRDPNTGLRRLSSAMGDRGWTSKTPTAEHFQLLGAAVPDVEGGLWIRDGALCLASRLKSEARRESDTRGLMVIACRGNLSDLGGA